MAAADKGLPGGAQKASVGTTGVAIDLTLFAKRTVAIHSDDDDLWFCFAASASDTTVIISGDLPASLTALKGKRTAKGYAVKRVVAGAYPFLIVRHNTLSGTVHVDVVSEANGSE